jgi:uncharacterized protein with von Willebrand factor type A (vWA) domain
VPDRFTGLLVGFARALRAAGLTAGTGDVLTYCEAIGSAATGLDPSDLVDLYWAGRVTLVNKKSDIPVYDKVFRRYFLAEDGPAAEVLILRARAAAQAAAELVLPETAPAPEEDRDDGEPAILGWMASDADALKHRSFAACTPAELAALRRIMVRMRLTPPRRRTRRTRTASSGRALDMRAMIRRSMRTHGEPGELVFRQRRTRPRRLILVLDVSGSMADYSRHLLQFAHTTRHAAARVEVFCFGTRLTRITRALSHRQPDAALAAAGELVADWEGGTRIGESLDTLVRTWGRAGLCRGGVVIICSDGLDRGDPEVLAAAMERLSRLCYRIVWLNPHKGSDQNFRPSTLGMMVAAPYVDHLLSGHDLASLEQLADLLPVLH